jgi:hypothetical protein
VPGAPFRAYTSRPESSARDGFPVNFATVTAFFIAFSSKVVPSSSTSGHPGKSSRVKIDTGIPSVILFISSIFFLFLVARTISVIMTSVYLFRMVTIVYSLLNLPVCLIIEQLFIP